MLSNLDKQPNRLHVSITGTFAHQFILYLYSRRRSSDIENSIGKKGKICDLRIALVRQVRSVICEQYISLI